MTSNDRLMVERFNAAHPIGTPVAVVPVIGRHTTAFLSATRTAAWVGDSGEALVMIDRLSGGYSLAAVYPLVCVRCRKPLNGQLMVLDHCGCSLEMVRS